MGELINIRGKEINLEKTWGSIITSIIIFTWGTRR